MARVGPHSEGQLPVTTAALLTVAEVAERLRVSDEAVLDLIHARQLPAIKVSSRRFRVEDAALQLFIAKRRTSSVIPPAVLHEAGMAAARRARCAPDREPRARTSSSSGGQHGA